MYIHVGRCDAVRPSIPHARTQKNPKLASDPESEILIEQFFRLRPPEQFYLP